MNAHVAIRVPAIRVDETNAERAHRHAISIHCPNCDEFEMATRVELAEIRDAATVGMARATDSAAVFLGEISRLATQAVYAQRSFRDLQQIKSTLALSMMSARQVDRMTRNG